MRSDYKNPVRIPIALLVLSVATLLVVPRACLGDDWSDILDLLNMKRTDVEKTPVSVPHPENINMDGVLAIRNGTESILVDYGFTGLSDALHCVGYRYDEWSEGFDCRGEISGILNLMHVTGMRLSNRDFVTFGYSGFEEKYTPAGYMEDGVPVYYWELRLRRDILDNWGTSLYVQNYRLVVRGSNQTYVYGCWDLSEAPIDVNYYWRRESSTTITINPM